MSRRLVARNVSVHVPLEEIGDAPVRVPDEFRGLASRFEGSHVRLLDGGDSRPEVHRAETFSLRDYVHHIE